jgi:hypothetical protein
MGVEFYDTNFQTVFDFITFDCLFDSMDISLKLANLRLSRWVRGLGTDCGLSVMHEEVAGQAQTSVLADFVMPVYAKVGMTLILGLVETHGTWLNILDD